MNFLLVLSALAAEATIGCATRVRVKTSGLSSQSGFKAPEVRQPQFAPALPAYFHTAARFHARLWQPAMGSSKLDAGGSSPLSRYMFSITSEELVVAQDLVFEVTRPSTDF
jgi:hypothetical protein